MSVGYGGPLLLLIAMLMIAILTALFPDWDREDLDRK
jgi:hypothetical protein